MHQGRPASPARRLAVAVLPVAAAGLAGSLVTRPAIPTWYAGLAKPGFTPPNWLFAPVWTLLYILMAYAVWRILSLPRDVPGRSGAIASFFVQLGLNALWSFAFFGLRSPPAGFLAILVLIAAIAWTIRAFRPLDRTAAVLLLPYGAWVVYAAALNGAVWRLNG